MIFTSILPLFMMICSAMSSQIFRDPEKYQTMGIFPMKKLATHPNKADSMGILAKNKLVTRVN